MPMGVPPQGDFNRRASERKGAECGTIKRLCTFVFVGIEMSGSNDRVLTLYGNCTIAGIKKVSRKMDPLSRKHQEIGVVRRANSGTQLATNRANIEEPS